MRIYLSIFAILSLLGASGCTSGGSTASPLETLQAYVIAAKAKDVTMMKLLLSEGTMKLHEQEAKVRGVTVDEIVLQQTLFSPEQRVFDYRNQKIEGNKATVEVKNSFGSWDTVFLVKEKGVWKIDLEGTSQKMIEDVDKQNQLLDKQINEGRIETVESPLPQGADSPAADPVPTPSSTALPTPSLQPPPPSDVN